MVLCFFDRFYVTVGDMHVSLYDAISPPGGRRQPLSGQLLDSDSV